ncbi:hypothetical protein H9638_13550 [Arthrobacter sp. Sa2BUA2]|uniref:DUF2975 domain-containing protein n=1 Tax=Arthrobacter pullicola TaxID=2762224 RepID=A0ABR8YL69_9MICC|nr:hypothetical protein [Arthrobacter pullicola]MBD8044831.1 hypothetical protein [Arthrobacter pullicola]
MDQQLGRGGSRERVLASVRVISAVLIAIAIGGIVLAVSSILWTSSAVTVRLPVQPFWPQLPEGTGVTDGPPAYVAGGGFTFADVEVADAGWDVRLWTAAGWAVQAAAAAAQVLSYSGWYGTAEPQLNGPLGVAPDPGVLIGFTPILWGLSLLLVSAAVTFAQRHGVSEGWRRPT